MYDVIVVGSGPAGASAAYFLRRGGARVLIIEKERLPRYKVCAGGVPASVMEFFPFEFEEVVEQEIEMASFCYRGVHILHRVKPRSLFTTNRETFDYFLLSKSGAEVIEGIKVTSVGVYRKYKVVRLSDGRDIRARYVIGADGVSSVVGRWSGLGLPPRMGLAVEAEIDTPPDLLEEYRGRILIGLGVLTRGYFWIFPKKRRLSVGIGTTGRERRLSFVLERLLKEYSLPHSSDKFYAHPLPLYGTKRDLERHGVFLVGDAASLVDPLTGEGIRHAVMSGRLAAQCILEGKEDTYSSIVHKKIGRDLKIAGYLGQCFYRNQRLSFECMVKNPLIFSSLIKVMCGRMSYLSMFFTSLLLLPLSPLCINKWRRYRSQ